MTAKIRIPASKAYDVALGRGLLTEAGARLREVSRGTAAVIVSDDRVDPLYGDRTEASLREAGFRTERFVFPHGEAHKTVETWKNLLEFLCEKRITRSDALVALGGGVVGDLTGFAAATYQRGIDFIQIPTTLLAMVDSSVGGKTAVDLDRGKNMAGAFYQPSLVLIDPDTLETLPEEEYRCGCAEVIKYAMIADGDFFRRLAEKPARQQYEEVILTCVEMKKKYVLEDEFDTGVRMFLNFGHTFGHAAEACSGFSVLHGQGVAIGMAIMCRAAAERGIMTTGDRDRVLDLLKQYGLPTEAAWPLKEMAEAARGDKKAAGSRVRLIVPEAIGRCRIETVEGTELETWLKQGGVS